MASTVTIRELADAIRQTGDSGAADALINGPHQESVSDESFEAHLIRNDSYFTAEQKAVAHAVIQRLIQAKGDDDDLRPE